MKIRAIVLLGAIAVVCLLLLTLQMRGYTAVATDALAVVTTPIQSALARVNRSAVGVWSTYQDWKNVRAENHNWRLMVASPLRATHSALSPPANSRKSSPAAAAP